MLIAFKIKIELPVIGFFNLSNKRFEKFVDAILDKQRMSKDTHNLHDGTANLMVMFNNANGTVCDDRNMYLDTDRILALIPKALDLEMLLDPLEEQLHLPYVPVEKSNLTCLEIEAGLDRMQKDDEVWKKIICY